MKLNRMVCLCLALAMLLSFAAFSGASADSGATLGSYAVYNGGHTRINWTVTGNPADEYKLIFQVKGNGNAAQARFLADSVYSDYAVTDSCVPGYTYSVILVDGNYNILDQRDYTISEAAVFEDGKLKDKSVKISIEPRKMAPGASDVSKANSLKASEIKAGFDSNSMYYGVKYQMKMPQLAKPRDFFVTLVFESPDGFLYVDIAKDVTFDRVNNGYQTIWWNLAGVDFFYNLYNITGDIPSGTYRTHLYWDGMWVNDSTFKVQ